MITLSDDELDELRTYCNCFNYSHSWVQYVEPILNIATSDVLYLSDEFMTALDKELRYQLNYMRENVELTEETIVPEPYTNITAKWK